MNNDDANELAFLQGLEDAKRIRDRADQFQTFHQQLQETMGRKEDLTQDRALFFAMQPRPPKLVKKLFWLPPEVAEYIGVHIPCDWGKVYSKTTQKARSDGEFEVGEGPPRYRVDSKIGQLLGATKPFKTMELLAMVSNAATGTTEVFADGTKETRHKDGRVEKEEVVYEDRFASLEKCVAELHQSAKRMNAHVKKWAKQLQEELSDDEGECERKNVGGYVTMDSALGEYLGVKEIHQVRTRAEVMTMLMQQVRADGHKSTIPSNARVIQLLGAPTKPAVNGVFSLFQLSEVLGRHVFRVEPKDNN